MHKFFQILFCYSIVFASSANADLPRVSGEPAWTTEKSAVGTPYLTVGNTDFAMIGLGGLRGNSSGSFVVNSVSGPVTRALLVWHGPTTTGNTTSSQLTLSGSNLVGSLLAVSNDNNWPPFTESRAYVADVTNIVTGNGSYVLGQLANSSDAAMNGASLLVFFNDGNANNNRDIVLLLGNDSNVASSNDAAGWYARLNGVNYSGGSAVLRLVVSDGQFFSPGTDHGFLLNGVSFLSEGQNFNGNTVPNLIGSSVTNGGLWDHKEYDISSRLFAGVNNLTLADDGSTGIDALSLIAVIFDLPPGTAPTPGVEVWPANCVTPSGFTTPAGATTGWSVVTDSASEGSCSLKSNPLGNAPSGIVRAQVGYTGAFKAGNIVFDRRVSSEGGYDCLRFTIDNVQQNIGGTCASTGGLGASGEVAWGPVSVPISAGMHTIMWSYEKDSTVAAGQDTAWIDLVALPLAPKKSGLAAIIMYLMD